MPLTRAVCVAAMAGVAWLTLAAQPADKVLVAHRGASAYAPEHTARAYELAIEQGADYVEPDLQITRDGVLVCLHDPTLERTTNVQEIFPDRARTVEWEGRTFTGWPVVDFTWEEIAQLDAGSWFAPAFAGERVLRFQDAIDLARGRAGLYPELKMPAFYAGHGFDMEALVVDMLRRNGLIGPGRDESTPVILQSFSEASLRRLAEEIGGQAPLVFLLDLAAAWRWATPDGLREIATFADGIGPAKRILDLRPDLVPDAHAAGLTVTPYTFRSSDTGRFATVRDEMAYYLYTLGVDAVFTDNPDQFPRR